MKKDKVKAAIILRTNEFETRILDTLKLPNDFSEKFIEANQVAFENIIELQEAFDNAFHEALNASNETTLDLIFSLRKKIKKLEDSDLAWFTKIIKSTKEKVTDKVNQLYKQEALKLKDTLLFEKLKESFMRDAQTSIYNDFDDPDDDDGGNYQ
jgi:hypothetical protein